MKKGEQFNEKIETSKDRLLPVQKALTDCYRENESEYFEKLHDLIVSFSDTEDEIFEKYDIELPKKMPYFRLGSDLPSLYFLQFMIKLCGYKTVLEIGTFVGMSAMCMADATNGGHVTTVEIGEEFYNLALQNIHKNGYSDKVTVLNSDALDLKNKLLQDQKFDLIYLDGDKSNYAQLFTLLFPYLSDRGMVIIDDILFHGDVLNENPISEKGKGVKKAINLIRNNNQVEAFLLPLSNGKLLITRK